MLIASSAPDPNYSATESSSSSSGGGGGSIVRKKIGKISDIYRPEVVPEPGSIGPPPPVLAVVYWP